MNMLLMIGSAIMVMALIFYSVGVLSEQRRRLVTNFVLIFVTLGWVCDVTGTVCMMIGAHEIITWHGVLGYTALIGMLVDVVLLYQFKQSKLQTPSSSLHLYTRMAYVWWVIAFVSGCVFAKFQ